MNEEQYAIPNSATTEPVVGKAATAATAADILAGRAKDLARETTKIAADDDTMTEVLEFSLADETYAFELTNVREVGALTDLTPLAGVPPSILGVTCVHGQIIAVLDLRKIFGMAERGLNDSGQAIILQSDQMEFAVLAEHVAGVRRIPLAGMQTSLPTLTDVRAAYLDGVTQDGTVVLSAAKLLADPQLIVNQNV